MVVIVAIEAVEAVAITVVVVFVVVGIFVDDGVAVAVAIVDGNVKLLEIFGRSVVAGGTTDAVCIRSISGLVMASNRK